MTIPTLSLTMRFIILSPMLAMFAWYATQVHVTAASPPAEPVVDSGSKKPTAAKIEIPEYQPKTESELRQTLTPLQFRVTQNEGTEPPFSNTFWNNKKKGLYRCVVCQYPLFLSKTKYKSGTGWPSFYAPIKKKSIGIKEDRKLIYIRREVHCSRCKSHLGHVFDDGPKPTGKRYCMNSASLKFEEFAESNDSAKRPNKRPESK